MRFWAAFCGYCLLQEASQSPLQETLERWLSKIVWSTVSKAALRSRSTSIKWHVIELVYKQDVIFHLLQSSFCTVLKWSCEWANTARSASFEANDRLLMGRRLKNSASAPVFFNLGLTSASFQSSGKVQHCRERLIILVITARRASRHSTT